MSTLKITESEQKRVEEKANSYRSQGFTFDQEFLHPFLTIKQQAHIENFMNFIHQSDAKLAAVPKNAIELDIFAQKFEKRKFNDLNDRYRRTLPDKRTYDRAIKTMEQYAAFYIKRDERISYGYETRDVTFFRWNAKRKVRFINLYSG